MKMKQVQQQVKGEIDTDKVITGLTIIVILITALIFFVSHQRISKEPVKTYQKDERYKEVEKAMRRNRYERNLSRKHGRDLKAIFDYVDR